MPRNLHGDALFHFHLFHVAPNLCPPSGPPALMKKNLITLCALLALLLAVFFGYRGYVRHKAENEQAA